MRSSAISVLAVVIALAATVCAESPNAQPNPQAQEFCRQNLTGAITSRATMDVEYEDIVAFEVKRDLQMAICIDATFPEADIVPNITKILASVRDTETGRLECSIEWCGDSATIVDISKPAHEMGNCRLSRGNYTIVLVTNLESSDSFYHLHARCTDCGDYGYDPESRICTSLVQQYNEVVQMLSQTDPEMNKRTVTMLVARWIIQALTENASEIDHEMAQKLSQLVDRLTLELSAVGQMDSEVAQALSGAQAAINASAPRN